VTASPHAWSAAAGANAPEIVSLPAGDELLIPVQLGISAAMIYAPKKKPIDKPKNLVFLVDSDGLPWLGNEGTLLLNVLKQSLVVVDPPYRDAVFLDNGAMLLCSEAALGFLEEPSESEKAKNKLLMHFHPRMTLPYKNMRIFAGANNTLYVVGKNPEDGKDELFLTMDAPDGTKKFVKLVAIKEGISAVTGDAQSTYFASGSLIVKVGPDHKKMERVIKLADDPIKELAYSVKAGLFYSTDKEVAYVGAKQPLVILKAPGVSIRMRGDSLFILFKKEQQIMAFGGVDGFTKLLGKK
jgi:hypothetical protein